MVIFTMTLNKHVMSIECFKTQQCSLSQLSLNYNTVRYHRSPPKNSCTHSFPQITSRNWVLSANFIILNNFLPPTYAIEVMFSSCMCVCLCVCLCICLCVCLFGLLNEFLVWWFILTMSRASLIIKVIGSRSSHGKC